MEDSPPRTAFRILNITFWILLAACASGNPASTLEPLTVLYTDAAQPWLANVYACAGKSTLVTEPRAADFFDPAADLAIRIGEPTPLSSPAYQIGMEEIVVVVNPQNPAASLPAVEVRRLFSGQITNWNELGGADFPVQVWVYAADEDVQQVFDAAAMQGTPVTSLARLAVSPQAMAAGVGSDPGAVGFLTHSLLTDKVRSLNLPGDTSAALTVPVLAMTADNPPKVVQKILTCLQK